MMYLAGGREFAERFIFFWRSPFYGLWVGIFYLLSGDNPELCFYIEKYVSTFLLGLATAYLGQQLFDTRTGLLMGIWMLNCKYLVIETNGSHILAATLFVVSLLAFFLPDKAARLPVALLFLWLSTQVRSEMWVPLVIVIIILSITALRHWKSKKQNILTLSPGKIRYWALSIITCVALTLLFNLRIGSAESHRFSEAFAMNFAMNYVDRLQLQATSTKDELDWKKIWVKAFPGVSTSPEAIAKDRGEIHPLTAILSYPQEVIAHIGYNLKLFARAFPAAFLAFDRRLLMLIALMIYLSSFILWKGKDGPRTSWNMMFGEDRSMLILWSLVILSLVPISLALRVVARYYLQLVPVQIMFTVLGLRMVMCKIGQMRITANTNTQ